MSVICQPTFDHILKMLARPIEWLAHLTHGEEFHTHKKKDT